MCIWAKYIAIVEHKANNVWHTIRHTIRSLLGIWNLGNMLENQTLEK